MIWTFEKEGPFRGESSIRVTNRRKGLEGLARVEYSPACQLAGPVVAYREGEGYHTPPQTEDILDYRPTFRNAGN